MKCYRCGIELPGESDFCLNCGLPVKKTEEYRLISEKEMQTSQEYKAKLIYQPDKEGSFIKIVASDLGMSDEEFDDWSLKDISQILEEKDCSVKDVKFDAGELIFHIFSAWH